jgi:hypothetical protein
LLKNFVLDTPDRIAAGVPPLLTILRYDLAIQLSGMCCADDGCCTSCCADDDSHFSDQTIAVANDAAHLVQGAPVETSYPVGSLQPNHADRVRPQYVTNQEPYLPSLRRFVTGGANVHLALRYVEMQDSMTATVAATVADEPGNGGDATGSTFAYGSPISIRSGKLFVEHCVFKQFEAPAGLITVRERGDVLLAWSRFEQLKVSSPMEVGRQTYKRVAAGVLTMAAGGTLRVEYCVLIGNEGSASGAFLVGDPTVNSIVELTGSYFEDNYADGTAFIAVNTATNPPVERIPPGCLQEDMVFRTCEGTNAAIADGSCMPYEFSSRGGVLQLLAATRCVDVNLRVCRNEAECAPCSQIQRRGTTGPSCQYTAYSNGLTDQTCRPTADNGVTMLTVSSSVFQDNSAAGLRNKAFFRLPTV